MRSEKVMRRNPNIPFDLVSEILSRLPVKSLLQFRRVSKSWKSLISDPIFARKHLNMSTTRRLLVLNYDNPSYRYIQHFYSVQSIFTDTDRNLTRFESKRSYQYYTVGSNDGILCFAHHFKPFVLLWNPSIGKSKELPPFENLSHGHLRTSYGFGYDHVSHDYKVVVIYNPIHIDNQRFIEGTVKSKVYTLSTNSWRTIQPFPFPFCTTSTYKPLRHVSGSINWVSYNQLTHQACIVSLDLAKESYQIILPPPPHFELKGDFRLSVLRDCLCFISNHDVWLMKEFGIQQSWTKLFNVTHLLDPPSKSFTLTSLLYIFEQDQVLLLFRKACETLLILYNPNNDTSKVCSRLNHISEGCVLEVCLESLISPCS